MARRVPRAASARSRPTAILLVAPHCFGAAHHASSVPRALFLAAAVLPAAAQSTAINGSIEGVVTDDSGAVLPGVTVTITNLDTGDTRVVVTNESGLYRAPLLPLGRYRVDGRAAGLQEVRADRHQHLGRPDRRHQHEAGRRRAQRDHLGHRRCAARRSRQDRAGGRTLTEAEIKTLPLTSRNPYNFALLQPGVVGFENQEFGVPRITSNGALLRVNYQIDGSNNTQKDRAGLRQMPMSEVMIREVKVVTTGYAPEFGQTMGLIYNAITPSGTNTYKGQGSYRFQRKAMAAFPFFTQGARNDDTKPPTEVNVYTVDIGGPVVRDRTHFFGGYEHTERDLSGSAVITITPANQAALGLTEPRYQDKGAQHRVRHRQGRPPAERRQPPVGALHLLRQLHHRQRRRRHRLGRSAAPTSPTASTRRRRSWSRPSAPTC